MGNLPITREKAIELLMSMPNEKVEMNHYLESEAIMRGVARKFGENEDYWGMLGLLHDVDWALTKNNWAEHTIKADKILKDAGFDKDFIQIVQSHAYSHPGMPIFLDKQRTKIVEYALTASETLTGIIYAYALIGERKYQIWKFLDLRKNLKTKHLQPIVTEKL